MCRFGALFRSPVSGTQLDPFGDDPRSDMDRPNLRRRIGRPLSAMGRLGFWRWFDCRTMRCPRKRSWRAGWRLRRRVRYYALALPSLPTISITAEWKLSICRDRSQTDGSRPNSAVPKLGTRIGLYQGKQDGDSAGARFVPPSSGGIGAALSLPGRSRHIPMAGQHH